MADYTDNFNRANAASPSTGAPYTITTLLGTYELLNNAIHDTDTSANDSWCRMEVDFQSSDHEVSVRLSTVTLNGATAVGAGPMISLDTNVSVTGFFVIADFVAQTMTILDVVGGTVTNAYGTSASLGAFAVGDVITLGRHGAYIYAQKNGTTVISARSGLYYTNVRGGVYSSRSGAAVDVAINNWHATEIFSTPPIPRAPGLFTIGAGSLIVPPPVDVQASAPATSLALSPATVTVTPVAPARTVGAVSKALSPATVTVTPVAPARTVGGVSRALSPATITVTPVALARVAAISRALNPATVTVTSVALARTAGGVSRALSPATVTVTSVALARTAARALAQSPATVTVTGISLARVVGGITRPLSPATVTATPVAPGITNVSAGAISLSMSPATVRVTPATLDVTDVTTSQGGFLRYGRRDLLVDTSDRRDILSTLERDEEDALLLVLIGASL